MKENELTALNAEIGELVAAKRKLGQEASVAAAAASEAGRQFCSASVRGGQRDSFARDYEVADTRRCAAVGAIAELGLALREKQRQRDELAIALDRQASGWTESAPTPRLEPEPDPRLPDAERLAELDAVCSRLQRRIARGRERLTERYHERETLPREEGTSLAVFGDRARRCDILTLALQGEIQALETQRRRLVTESRELERAL